MHVWSLGEQLRLGNRAGLLYSEITITPSLMPNLTSSTVYFALRQI